MTFSYFPFTVNDKVTHLSLLFKFVLSKRYSNSLWGSDVLLFLEFIYIVSILLYNFIEFIIMLYSFFVISSVRYKEYMICLISFNKFSGELPTFTCGRAIGNFWSICLGVNISSPSPWIYFSSPSLGHSWRRIII